MGHAGFVSIGSDGAGAEGAAEFGGDDEEHGDDTGVEADAKGVGDGGEAGEVGEHEAGGEGEPHFEEAGDVGVGAGAAPDDPADDAQHDELEGVSEKRDGVGGVWGHGEKAGRACFLRLMAWAMRVA